MPWTSKVDRELGIVEVVLTAPLTASDLRELTPKVIAQGKEAGTNRFLVDATKSVMTATLFDILRLPEETYDKEGADRGSRIAMIEPESPRDLEAARFYETACRNRGWAAKVFADRRGAVGWLLGPAA